MPERGTSARAAAVVASPEKLTSETTPTPEKLAEKPTP